MSLPTDAVAAAWQSRYLLPAPDALPWNDTLALLLSHRSVRRFRPDPVSDETLAALVAAAQSAATSSNLQVWSVVAVRDPARKARLATFAGRQAHVEQAPLFLVWLADLSRARQLAEAAGTPLAGQDYFEAAILGIVDAALAAQNALVAAESLGLGGVYIGGIRNQTQAVIDELRLPSYVVPVFGLALGVPAEGLAPDVKPRLGQNAVLHLETYDAERQQAEMDAYEQRAAAFYAEQGLAESWQARVRARLKDAAALHGRDVLREVWQAHGYAMK